LLLCDFKSDEAVQLVDRRAKRTWNQPLAAGTTLYLAFHKKGAQVPFIGESNVVVYDEATTDFTNVTQLVVVDCPENIAELKEICQAHLFERIYLYCYTREEAYLAGMGTHEQYARLYKFVAQQATLDVRYKLKSIANYLKIPENLLVFMIRVFFELKFVTIDDGVLKKVENAEKRAFSESTLYQMRQQQIKTEEFLLLSDLDTIKQWLSK
jgi:single-stranded-DNA-specific exonuclease